MGRVDILPGDSDRLFLGTNCSLEESLARYPRFCSRIALLHEFRPLGSLEIFNTSRQALLKPGH